ncbi:unnamed protein product [Effrenium voratum]|nr:unnamed protein product [Effrenium voratum]
MGFLATFGMTAKNMFDYNSFPAELMSSRFKSSKKQLVMLEMQVMQIWWCWGENFQFDQEQRLSRELLRQILQLKRFTLFREDIRDLVELTVGKMEMYHLVAALFMESSMALYFEGRIHHASPPFLLSLLYISIASAFMYLLLAVWLSMHASICSHSFGVRLLTRFVRLPVPGLEQMGAMNARLADFEKQGVKGMLRVPVVGGRQDWVQRQPQLPALREEGERNERNQKPIPKRAICVWA